MNTSELIDSQIAYYRARAAAYDGELARAAADDALAEFMERYDSDTAQFDAWLLADPPRGHVLEMAAGSGNRTGRLLRSADRVTAVDAAPEMLELLAGKHPDVERIEADLFRWEPPKRYDAVFFGFWMSHVPGARWEAFWRLLDRSLVPGGRVWFIDNAHPDYINVRAPGDWPVTSGIVDVYDLDSEVQARTLEDGTRWAMVKRFWWPEELSGELARLGWRARVDHTDSVFIYGTAHRR